MIRRDLTSDLIDYTRDLIDYQSDLPNFIFDYLDEIRSNFEKNSIFICEVLIDYSWEMLNTNLWCFVDNSWRYIYGYSILYKILILENRKQPQELIKLCDLGLLISGPLLEKQFNQIISSLSRMCNSKIEDFNAKAKLIKLDIPQLNDKFKLTIEESPSFERFNEFFFRKNIPVIINGQMRHWPAMKKWSIDYIIKLAGKRTVPIEIGSKYTDENWSQKLMTIEDFIKKYIFHETNALIDKGYLAQHPLFSQIPELRDDIYIPEYCNYTSKHEIEENNVEINAWFGPEGTVSPLHFDPKSNFLCQVIGKKYVKLYDEKYSENLYPHEGNILRNTSQIDAENIDYEKFKLAKDIPFWEGIINEGQMLYIPPKCWHYIKSLSMSFSVNFWWE